MDRSSSTSSAVSIRQSLMCVAEQLRFRLKIRPPPPSPLPPIPPVPTTALVAASASPSVPWMRCPQDGRLHHLRPERYRETPVYSDPGSPLLSRFYFNDDDHCYPSAFPDPPHAEIAIINDCEEADSVDSRSRASLDYGESLRYPASVDTRATSVASRCSLQCQGEADTDNEPLLREWDTRKASSLMSCEFIDNDDEGDDESDVDEDHEIKVGLLHVPSWRSNQASFGEASDAHATALSPAKAHVVDVTKSSYPSSVISWGSPSSPQSSRDIQSCPAPDAEEDEIETPRPASHSGLSRSSRASGHSIDQGRGSPVQSKSPVCEPFDSYSWYAEQTRASVCANEPDQGIDLVEAISSSVESFPREMLTLDTPCVVEIRRRNKNLRISHPSKTSPRLSYSSRRSSCCRLTRIANLDDLASLADGTSLPTACTEHVHDDRAADLRPLRAIFTQTNDWWRGLLYAYLVAYNHITTLQAPSLPTILSAHNIPLQSAKTRKRKKIPRDSTFGPPPSLDSPSLASIVPVADVEDALTSCITCVANFMAGHNIRFRDEDEDDWVRSGAAPDRILVKSLAAVVMGCEGL